MDSNSFDFMWLAAQLQSNAGQVITVAGAGLSTSSGIPDFRGPSGLYAIMQSGAFEGIPISSLLPPGLPVEAVFSIDLFRMKPEIFYRIANVMKNSLLSAKPTPAHYLLKIMADCGYLKTHFTQNVDGLEHAAGMDASKIVEAHGTFRRASCLECKTTYSFEWLISKFSEGYFEVLRCEVCSGLVKPDVILFGEALPEQFFLRAHSDAKDAKVMLIFGASLAVQPFASLPSFVSASCDRIFISLDEPNMTDWQKRNGMGRDVAFRGSCDDFARGLARALEKEQELNSFLCNST